MAVVCDGQMNSCSSCIPAAGFANYVIARPFAGGARHLEGAVATLSFTKQWICIHSAAFVASQRLTNFRSRRRGLGSHSRSSSAR